MLPGITNQNYYFRHFSKPITPDFQTTSLPSPATPLKQEVNSPQTINWTDADFP